jgi:nucleoside-diphosphate-sugar epimerase
MIIGSGLLAHAFAPLFTQRTDVLIYAAGVSNSACLDVREFARERHRLTDALKNFQSCEIFVYFGTCSVMDPEAFRTPYVQHKLAMENLVATHPRYLILRLPQVAGKTPNPHTLLNFLYARVARSEEFSLWRHAKRNIIDVVDVVAITQCLLEDVTARNSTINVANPINYSMMYIVSAMEKVVGKRAIYNILDRGSDYAIETGKIQSLVDKTNVKFGDGYIQRVIGNYYENAN